MPTSGAPSARADRLARRTPPRTSHSSIRRLALDELFMVPKTGRDGSAGRSSVGSTAALEVGGGADELDMAEGLGEVAEQLATGRVDLLGQLPQVVGLAQQPLEQCDGPVGLASEGEVVDQPQAGVYPPQAQAFPI